MSEKHLLSKTSFLKAVQCPKAFFLYKKYYHLRDPLPLEKQRIFKRGHQVGLLAQQLFPGGVDASPTHVFKFHESVQKTKEFIASGQTVIYEAAFVFDDTLVAVDVLVKKNENWHAYEVKSSFRIRQAYVMDAALQYYVIKNSLPSLTDISLVTMNESYELKGELSIPGLFRLTSVKKDAERNTDFIKFHIKQARDIFYKNELPEIKIGEQCFTPYECDFKNTCWKNISADSVFTLSGISKKQATDWFNRGFTTIRSIPPGETEGDTKKAVLSFQQDSVLVNSEKIKEALSKLFYPLAFLDMEFNGPAIPRYQSCSPFQQLPFLFSLRFISKPGSDPRESLFFHEEDSNPSLPFMEALINQTKKAGSILVFDTGQENNMLNKLKTQFPQFEKEVSFVQGKLFDLAPLFTNLHYYNPRQKGSFSLKSIHESIFSKDIYAGMPVNSGLLASYGYDEFLMEPDPFIKQERKEQLIQYCLADTLALQELFFFLQKNAG